VHSPRWDRSRRSTAERPRRCCGGSARRVSCLGCIRWSTPAMPFRSRAPFPSPCSTPPGSLAICGSVRGRGREAPDVRWRDRAAGTTRGHPRRRRQPGSRQTLDEPAERPARSADDDLVGSDRGRGAAPHGRCRCTRALDAIASGLDVLRSIRPPVTVLTPDRRGTASDHESSARGTQPERPAADVRVVAGARGPVQPGRSSVGGELPEYCRLLLSQHRDAGADLPRLAWQLLRIGPDESTAADPEVEPVAMATFRAQK
jgi:hypothetical protein